MSTTSTTAPDTDPVLARMFSLTGRTAAVTGASKGIGLGIATLLAQAGADVVGISTTMADGDTDARRAVEAAGRRFTPIATDLSDRAAVADLGERLAGLEVDVLVNNGGTIRRAPAAEHPDADFDHVVEVNLRSAWTLSREVGRSMLARGYGKIINTASMLSFQGGVNVPGYTSSKSALAGLTKALANEWAGRGVNVNAVAPGYVATANTDALRADAHRNAEILGRIPAGRWATPEDIAGAVLYLAAPASDYVHGAILPVDGGWLAR